MSDAAVTQAGLVSFLAERAPSPGRTASAPFSLSASTSRPPPAIDSLALPRLDSTPASLPFPRRDFTPASSPLSLLPSSLPSSGLRPFIHTKVRWSGDDKLTLLRAVRLHGRCFNEIARSLVFSPSLEAGLTGGVKRRANKLKSYFHSKAFAAFQANH